MIRTAAMAEDFDPRISSSVGLAVDLPFSGSSFDLLDQPDDRRLGVGDLSGRPEAAAAWTYCSPIRADESQRLLSSIVDRFACRPRAWPRSRS